MSTLGYTGSPPNTDTDFSTHAGAQMAALVTMPAGGGLISDIHVYARTDSGSSHAGFLCLWDSSGNLLASVACTIPGSIAYIGGTLTTPYFVTGSTNFFIGVQNSDTSTSGLFMQYNATTGTIDWGFNSGAPSALANTVQDTTRQIGAYVDYTPGGVFVNTGTPSSPTWTAASVYVNTGTPSSPVWTPAVVYVNTGTPSSPVWTPSS